MLNETRNTRHESVKVYTKAWKYKVKHTGFASSDPSNQKHNPEHETQHPEPFKLANFYTHYAICSNCLLNSGAI